MSKEAPAAMDVKAVEPVNVTIIEGAGDGVKQDEFFLENIPYLDFIPVERKRLLGSKNAARHELQHAIVAQAYGIRVGEINCVGDGKGVGGWTVLGPGEDHKVQVVLAAGGVGGTGGTAGDFAMSQILDIKHQQLPGITFPVARDKAAEVIGNRIDGSTLSIAADILAYLGEVSALELNAVLERARFEAFFKTQNINLADLIADNPFKEALQQQRKNKLRLKAPIPESGNGIVIEEFGELNRITIWVGGKAEKAEIRCPKCGSTGGGHLPICEFNQKENILIKDNMEMRQIEKEWDNENSIIHLDLNGKKREGGVLVSEDNGIVFSWN
jgi:hypothetical protein